LPFGVRVVRVGLLGYGRVGQAVALRAVDAGDTREETGLEIRPTIALVRDRTKTRSPQLDLCTEISDFFRQRLDVVVEVMGSVHPAFEYVTQAIERGIPVVTANKSLIAEKGVELRALSRERGVPLAFEAAVIAGVPFIGALARRPLCRRVQRMTGILNGTSHFLTSEVSGGRRWDDALADAIRLGYAEPDCEADVSGRDAAEKLAILLQLAGCSTIRESEITKVRLDALHGLDYQFARELDHVIKPVALAVLTRTAGAWVGPALLAKNHSWAGTRGVENAVRLEGDDAVPLTFGGPGAGPLVTATTILDDVIEALTNKGEALAPPERAEVAVDALRQPPASAWYIRILGGDVPLGVEDVAEHLAAHRLPATRLTASSVAVAAITAPASWAAAQAATDAFRAVGHHVVLLPVLPGGCRE
jgi:homoserine dehydrogenase